MRPRAVSAIHSPVASSVLRIASTGVRVCRFRVPARRSWSAVNKCSRMCATSLYGHSRAAGSVTMAPSAPGTRHAASSCAHVTSLTSRAISGADSPSAASARSALAVVPPRINGLRPGLGMPFALNVSLRDQVAQRMIVGQLERRDGRIIGVFEEQRLTVAAILSPPNALLHASTPITCPAPHKGDSPGPWLQSTPRAPPPSPPEAPGPPPPRPTTPRRPPAGDAPRSPP